jgi:transposase
MCPQYRYYDGEVAYAGRQYVGIDLHRRRSVIVRLTESGERLDAVRIVNDPVALGLQIEQAGEDPEVVLEATYGWYWAVDVLQAAGAKVHLAHPLGMKMFSYRRYKDDIKDSHDMADLLRMGRLPEAWIPPREVRELRELVRYRAKLVAIRSGFKAQVHAVLAKVGIAVTAADLFAASARDWLEHTRMESVYAMRIGSLLGFIDQFDTEESRLNSQIAARIATHDGYRAIQTIPGIGPVLAAVFTAEIGDVHRFDTPAQLCSWAGLTPKHYESDTMVRQGHVTKQGSKLVRWAAVESIQRQTTTKIAEDRDRIAQRRGKNIGKVAAARKQLTHVYYGLRDHHVRALARDQAPA